MGSAYEYAYGRHTVTTILQTHPETVANLKIINSPDPAISAIKKLAQQHNIAIEIVDAAAINKATQTNTHQGVAVKVRKLSYQDLDSLLIKVENKAKACILVLDQIQDPHNLGAIIRTAEAFGVAGIIVTKQHAAPLNALVRKVASGAAELLPLIAVSNITRAIEELKQHNFWIIGGDAAGSTDIASMRAAKTVLVLGAEGSGLRALTKKSCDFLAAIPLPGKTPSLNVSVATGVLLYSLLQT